MFVVSVALAVGDGHAKIFSCKHPGINCYNNSVSKYMCVCVSFPTIPSGLPISEIGICKSRSQGIRYAALPCGGTTEDLFRDLPFPPMCNICNSKDHLGAQRFSVHARERSLCFYEEI